MNASRSLKIVAGSNHGQTGPPASIKRMNAEVAKSYGADTLAGLGTNPQAAD